MSVKRNKVYKSKQYIGVNSICIKVISNKFSKSMSKDDFKGNFKYKLIVPAFYIISWIMMFLGPTFMQVQYQYICICIILHTCFKMTINAIFSFIVWLQSLKTFAKAKALAQEFPNVEQELTNKLIHTFIIPNYKEDPDLISETLQQLAQHHWAKSKYAVYLAMQGHEQNSDLKAESLTQKYKDKFLHIGYTIHYMRQFQQKGKASNVSWCVQQLQQILFKPNHINQDQVFITIIDSDSFVPQLYTHEIEDHLAEQHHFQNRHQYIYCPNQVFLRNHREVPTIIRTCDDLHACMHNMNLVSIFNIIFPLSNYTMSYTLIKKVGFWDTCADAIAEDYHTTLKIIWKTQGKVIGVPIYTPFSQVNLSTGKGLWKDIQAKFWQTERHGSAVVDVAYCFNMLIRNSLNLRSIVSSFFTLQAFLLPAISPWAAASLMYQPLIIARFFKQSPQLFAFPYINIMLNYITLITCLTYLFYFLIKHKAAEILYGCEKESWFRFIQFALFIPINTFFIDVPAITIAAFNSLFEAKEYFVADKVISKHDFKTT